MLRRTRIVCVSDTHNASPEDGAFALPKGDILIHAGDLTKQGTFRELQKTVAWIEAADYEAKIVVAGNHDITLDPTFYAQYAAHFHNQRPQDPVACRQLLQDASSITYLENTGTEVRLRRASGPRTWFRVFGSPLSPAQADGKPWAFQYAVNDADDNAAAADAWARIPLETDIVITHTPPKGHCDGFPAGSGCEKLHRALWRVRPRLHICGHVHEARGAERVRWDLAQSNVRFKEQGVVSWEDSSKGTKKQALLDLSARSTNPLQNDGGHPDLTAQHTRDERLVRDHADRDQAAIRLDTLSSPSEDIVRAQSPARGLGGRPLSGRCDIAALHGRLGRQETCVINASIMASSYPYKGKGTERYNKPIVVDIDLPVCEDGEA